MKIIIIGLTILLALAGYAYSLNVMERVALGERLFFTFGLIVFVALLNVRIKTLKAIGPALASFSSIFSRALASFSSKEVPSVELVEEQGVMLETNSKTPFDGPWWALINGRLRTRGSYKNGKKDGHWETYSEKGVLARRVSFEDGIEHGTLSTYHEDGGLCTRESYIAGAKTGPFEVYYSNLLFSRTQYKNGKKHGVMEHFFLPSGTLMMKSCFKDDHADGLWERYAKNGQCTNRLYRKNGKTHGLQEKFFLSGALKWKCYLKNGEKDGLFETYYKNGQLKCKVNYKDGKHEELGEYYNENGQLISREEIKANPSFWDDDEARIYPPANPFCQ